MSEPNQPGAGCEACPAHHSGHLRRLGVDMDEMPASVRQSMDGEVPADMSFDDWLKGKSKTFQDQLLGKGKADLWRNGAITLTDLVDQTGRPLSLAALRKLS